MTRLLLIRHGQTFSNLTRSLDTCLPGAALTDLGWEQSRVAGERIAREYEADLVLASSQALRAQQTASGIVEGAAGFGLTLPTPESVPGISEIPAGDLEMRNDEESHYTYHRTFGEWLGGSLDLVLPGALSGREVVERYLEALLPMVARAQVAGADLAVVSHGAVIRLIAGYLGRVDPEYAVRTMLPNTSRVELEVPEFDRASRGSAGPVGLIGSVGSADSVNFAGSGASAEAGVPRISTGQALPTLPTLQTTDAPMVETVDYLPAGEVADTAEVEVDAWPAATAEGWKVMDWAGRGEPPRVR